MDKQVVDWLLQGSDWIKYAVEKQILENKPDNRTVILNKDIQEIVQRLKDSRRGILGIPNGMDADSFGNPYWDLFFLADLGLSAAEVNLDKEIEHFLCQQASDGTYLTEYGMKPNYFCKSVILLSAMARMGYQSDPHIQKLIKVLLGSQRLDGGWYCNTDHAVGAPLQFEDSCPQENLNNLLLLGNYPEYRSDGRFDGAIDLLLKHWEMHDRGTRIVYFGVGKRYQSLQYPATRYGIVRVLDALSLYSHALKQSAFRNMLEFVQHKNRGGRYFAETPTLYTNLEPAVEGSRLLTFIVMRVEKRLASYH